MEEKNLYLTDWNEVYKKLIEELKRLYSAPTVSLWFEPMQIVSYWMNAVCIYMPQNRRPFVETEFSGVLREKISEILGMDVEIKLLTDEEYSDMNAELCDGIPEHSMFGADVVSAYKRRFDPEYTFKNFVVGKSNQLAQSSALAVAKHPAELNNPLFLYGNSGLGKTHLMFAIVNEIRANHPDYNILYVTGEEFTNELIESLALKKSVTFRGKYRNVDVLLIDDIQFIAGKMGVQEEFFHTFDTLYTANKQIIIASDRAPREIDHLEERLQSRFEMGLMADIQPPDKELRMAIFKRKANDYGITISMDVLYYLAENITTNIRQIEGALKKLKAKSLISGENITLTMAENELSDYFVTAKNDDSLIDRIFEAAEKRYGVNRDELKSAKRSAEIVAARHYAIYLIRKTTNLSQNSIAKLFNKKDHTTVINSISFIERKMKNEPVFERDINKTISELKQQ